MLLQGRGPFPHRGMSLPGAEDVLIKGKENAFAIQFDGRKPVAFAGEVRRHNLFRPHSREAIENLDFLEPADRNQPVHSQHDSAGIRFRREYACLVFPFGSTMISFFLPVIRRYPL